MNFELVKRKASRRLTADNLQQKTFNRQNLTVS